MLDLFESHEASTVQNTAIRACRDAQLTQWKRGECSFTMQCNAEQKLSCFDGKVFDMRSCFGWPPRKRLVVQHVKNTSVAKDWEQQVLTMARWVQWVTRSKPLFHLVRPDVGKSLAYTALVWVEIPWYELSQHKQEIQLMNHEYSEINPSWCWCECNEFRTRQSQLFFMGHWMFFCRNYRSHHPGV